MQNENVDAETSDIEMITQVSVTSPSIVDNIVVKKKNQVENRKITKSVILINL